MKVLVKNAAHKMMPQQAAVLTAAGWAGDVYDVPEVGLNIAQMGEVVNGWVSNGVTPVFMSPIAALMALCQGRVKFMVLHNDKRVAREFRQPDGTTVMRHVVAADGWQLV